MKLTVFSFLLCGCSPQVNLKEQGQLIRQDEFTVFFRKKKCVRRIFLFEHLVLFSKTKRTDVGNDVYVYKQSFKVSTEKAFILNFDVLTYLLLIVLSYTSVRHLKLQHLKVSSGAKTCCCVFSSRRATLGWPITLVWAACVLRSGSAEGRARTPTPWNPPAWRWRKPGPPIWRGSSGIRPLTAEVVKTTIYIYLSFSSAF